MAASKYKICKAEYGGQSKKKVSYNRYLIFNQLFISAMKGIAKDCISLQYERLM